MYIMVTRKSRDAMSVLPGNVDLAKREGGSTVQS